MQTKREIEAFSRSLRAAGTKERAVQEKRYLRSELGHFGVTVPKVREIAKCWLREHEEMSREELLALARGLFETQWYEHRAIAAMLLHTKVDLLTSKDVLVIEELIRRSKTWALVDELAPRVMGSLVTRDAKLVRVLRRWAKDPDFWVRRASLLTLLLPLRKGEGDFALFSELAIPMLGEKEFFVRKAIGWILREVSRKRPALVARFVKEHGKQMSGLTRREATKYL